MMRSLKSAATALLAAAGVLVLAGSAGAGVVTVWPDQLLNANGGVTVFQDADRLEGGADYFRVIRLPFGKRIVSARATVSSPSGGFDWCLELARRTSTGEMESLIYFNAPLPLDPIDPRQTLESDDVTDEFGPRYIARGYRYYVNWQPTTTGSLHSIQIIYR